MVFARRDGFGEDLAGEAGVFHTGAVCPPEPGQDIGLAEIVGAPGGDGAVTVDGQAVVIGGGNGRDVVQPVGTFSLKGS